MAIENVVCPRCGREAFATIPSGQRLIEIFDYHKTYSNTNTQTCNCKNCGRNFYAVTMK